MSRSDQEILKVLEIGKKLYRQIGINLFPLKKSIASERIQKDTDFSL
jgi:hypothetical protein